MGRSQLTVSDLNLEHLRKLNNWIVKGSAEHIFVSSGVIRLMKSTKLFPWLYADSSHAAGPLKVLFHQPGENIYQHLHFSNYGKFAPQKQIETEAIRNLLINYC